MGKGLTLSFFWSRALLLNKGLLWLLLLCNLAGTVYGYEWYWHQLQVTVANYPLWYVPFVPDSPTASLFFTLSLIFLIRRQPPADAAATRSAASPLRGFIEAFALITSFKYGVWAVTMIWAAAAQGDPAGWQGWMLTLSHLAMAVEALLYARWYVFGWGAIALTAAWTFWNDFMDYQRGIYPWLRNVLLDDLTVVEGFTIALSVVSVGIALVFLYVRNRKKQKQA